MSALLDRMIREAAFSVFFQPIFEITTPVPVPWAVEALTRGPLGSHFESASVLFDYVRFKRDEVRIDRHCCGNAIRAAARLQPLSIVTINAHASTLERDASFPSFLASTCEAAGFPSNRLVVEIVEHVPYRNVSRLRAALAELRSAGIRVAVDDLGFGHGNLRMVLDVRPEFLKIERYFVDGCAVDGDRRAMLRSITRLAHDFQSLVIAEGVERRDDFEVLRDIGIPLAQGYLLARPMVHSHSGEHVAGLASPLEDPLLS